MTFIKLTSFSNDLPVLVQVEQIKLIWVNDVEGEGTIILLDPRSAQLGLVIVKESFEEVEHILEQLNQ